MRELELDPMIIGDIMIFRGEAVFDSETDYRGRESSASRWPGARGLDLA